MVTKTDVINVLDNAIGCATDDKTIECLETAKDCVKKYYDNCETKDCLSCANSFSESSNNGDILHCMEQDGEIVCETDWCVKWN